MKSVTPEYIVSKTNPDYNFRFKAYYIDSIEWPIVNRTETSIRTSYHPDVPVEYKNAIKIEWRRSLYLFDPIVPKPKNKSAKRYYVCQTQTFTGNNIPLYGMEIYPDTMIICEPLFDLMSACNDIKENERFICLQVR